MSIDPGFTWSDVMDGVNSFLQLAPISGMLLAIIALGIAGMIIRGLKGMLED